MFHLIFRGDKFRTEFSHLDEIRSIIPETVRVMALTATATLATRKFIIKSLIMQKPDIIYVSPDKPGNYGSPHVVMMTLNV